MRVSQKSKFKPIIITLETEGEAVAMWGSLFCNEGAVRETLTSEGVPVPEHLDEITSNMWNEFYDVFDPREGK